MRIFKGKKVVVKSWCENPESGAIDQAKNLASLPFAFKHVALMPDTHWGYGMPIGGVLATEGVVIPNAVGGDIGCGMCAVKTSLTEINTELLKSIMGEIREAIPVGSNRHKRKQDLRSMPTKHKYEPSKLIHYGLEESKYIVFKEFEKALTQVGTLGGGNHFIEIQQEVSKCPQECGCMGTGTKKGNIWIMIHSGSRNLGKQVADYYNKIAIELNKKWKSEVPRHWDLAFLPFDSQEGQDYVKEMQYCVEFALANRKLMMDRIIEIFVKAFNVKTEFMINIAHNYARLENHFGRNVVIHRKGATAAYEGQIGIIPGSQGTSSYIVKGKGNRESFKSCSHGAGRIMGRKEAKRRLNLEEEQKKLDDQGIIHSVRNQSDLDEAVGSYKNIDLVMSEQKDLVDIVVKLKPLGVIKG